MPSSVCYKQIGHLLVTGGRIVHGVLSNRGTVVYICIYVYIYICTGLRKQFCTSIHLFYTLVHTHTTPVRASV